MPPTNTPASSSKAITLDDILKEANELEVMRLAVEEADKEVGRAQKRAAKKLLEFTGAKTTHAAHRAAFEAK